jgi:hypothetical protein
MECFMLWIVRAEIIPIELRKAGWTRGSPRFCLLRLSLVLLGLMSRSWNYQVSSNRLGTHWDSRQTKCKHGTIGHANKTRSYICTWIRCPLIAENFVHLRSWLFLHLQQCTVLPSFQPVCRKRHGGIHASSWSASEAGISWLETRKNACLHK